MQYLKIPQLNIPISRFVYGLGFSPVTDGDKNFAFSCLDCAIENGFNSFDTANAYGFSEQILGSFLKDRHLTHSAVIIDKGMNCGMIASSDVFGGHTIISQIENSLRLLNRDYIDIYILHRDDPSKPVDEIIDTLNLLQKQGKIILFGASNWTYERIVQANDYALKTNQNSFYCVSPCYSLVDFKNDIWGGSVCISGRDSAHYRKFLKDSQTPVFSYSSLARGYLSGKFIPSEGRQISDCIGTIPIAEYDCVENRNILDRAEKVAKNHGVSIPQVALAYILNSGMNVFPIVSPTKQKHIADVTAALDLSLSQEELDYLKTE